MVAPAGLRTTANHHDPETADCPRAPSTYMIPTLAPKSIERTYVGIFGAPGLRLIVLGCFFYILLGSMWSFRASGFC